jgi:hypothetical protein
MIDSMTSSHAAARSVLAGERRRQASVAPVRFGRRGGGSACCSLWRVAARE